MAAFRGWNLTSNPEWFRTQLNPCSDLSGLSAVSVGRDENCASMVQNLERVFPERKMLLPYTGAGTSCAAHDGLAQTRYLPSCTGPDGPAKLRILCHVHNQELQTSFCAGYRSRYPADITGMSHCLSDSLLLSKTLNLALGKSVGSPRWAPGSGSLSWSPTTHLSTWCQSMVSPDGKPETTSLKLGIF